MFSDRFLVWTALLDSATGRRCRTAIPDRGFGFTNQRRIDYTRLSTDASRGWSWKEALYPDGRSHFEEYLKAIIERENRSEPKQSRWQEER